MASVPWMAPLPRSNTPFVDAPDQPADRIAEARARVDDVLTPELPLWYRTVAVLGWGWYLVATLIVLGVCLLVGLGPVWSSIIALIVGPAFSLISAMTMARAARAQAFGGERREQAKAVLTESATLTRLAMPGLVHATERILRHEPSMEQDVHELAWYAAGDAENDPDAHTASARLFDLAARYREQGPE